MPTTDIESKIDVILGQQQAAETEQARAAVRAQLVEKERIAQEAKEQARIASVRAAYLARAEAAHKLACTRYKAAVSEFRDARVQLQALDTILNRQGFGGFSLGVELRHSCAAPDEDDIHNGLGAAVAAVKKQLGEPT